MNADGSAARQLTTNGSGGHFMRWTTDGKGLFLSARTPSASHRAARCRQRRHGLVAAHLEWRAYLALAATGP